MMTYNKHLFDHIKTNRIIKDQNFNWYKLDSTWYFDTNLVLLRQVEIIEVRIKHKHSFIKLFVFSSEWTKK